MIGKKHEAVAVVVADPAELKLPDVGLMDIEDPETGEIITIDTSSKAVRREYEKWMRDRKEMRDQELRRSQIERIDILTHQDIVSPLVQFFQRRHRR